MRRPAKSAAFQLEIPWLDSETLQAELEQRTNMHLRLVVTDNTSTMMTLKQDRRERITTLRLHHMFLSAGPQVIHALADWIQRPRRGRADGVLGEFIGLHGHLIRTPERAAGARTKGARHDLPQYFDELNHGCFAHSVTAEITWGRRPSGGRRRSIRFGSFTASDNIIRIHPLLDQEFVPEYFVRYIVFHEMLHAFLGTEDRPNGRRGVHTKAFLEQEREFPDYARAMAWQENLANLRRLLR